MFAGNVVQISVSITSTAELSNAVMNVLVV